MIKMSSKKAQVGEVIEDFPSFIVIIFILFLLILFSVVLYKSVDKVRAEKIDSLVIHDKINFMLSSLMQEKENGISFSDRLRSRIQGTEERIEQEIDVICSEENKKCGSEIFYENSRGNCPIENNPEEFCFFVPADGLIAIKIRYSK